MKTIKCLMRSILTIILAVTMVMSSAFAFWPGDRLRNYDWGDMPTIRSGSSGGAVKGCQQFLRCAGYSSIVGAADGSFGAKTTAAVKAYQRAYDLEVDGIVGINTWSSMNDGLNYYDEGPVNYSYSVTGGSFGDDRFKHQHSSSSSQGAIGSWWVQTDTQYAQMCS